MRLMATPDLTGPVNLGNPAEFTVRELAEMVIELTGSRSVIQYRPLPQDDPLQRQPDIAQARERLGWEPSVPLREGLARTIAYFESKLRGFLADVPSSSRPHLPVGAMRAGAAIAAE